MRTVRAVPLLLAFAAGLHLAVLPSHLEEGAAVGGFFLAVAAAQLVSAVLVHRGASPVARRAVVAMNLGVVAVWVVSRTVGLPVVGGAGPEAVGALDALAVVAQLAAVAGLVARFASGAVPATRMAGIPALGMVVVLATGVGLRLVPDHHTPARAEAPAGTAPAGAQHEMGGSGSH